MSAHRITIFGAGGQLGSALARRAAAREASVIAFARADADITDAHAVRRVLAATDIVVNAAAYTAVDRAESDAARAFAVNRDGAANVAEAATAIGATLIHMSTDYVFDGASSEPYTESDPIVPLGVYGRSKADGEAAVLRIAPTAVVLRTAWVYGLEGANFVKTMLRLGTEREVVRVVDDQRGSPSFADDLADAILTLAARISVSPRSRIYHLAGQGVATWHEFAREIFAEAAEQGLRTPRLDAISTREYPTPAKRPANSVLDCRLIEHDFGIALPPWRDGLRRMLKAYLETAR